ncbi:MAG TPA: 16S rRNA (uracil(1498)-N(3))-methyltransferase [Anaerolineae bacterium]
MHRFFLPAENLSRRPVILTGAQAHQIRRVLRLAPGAAVVLLDNTGRAYEATITGFGPDDVRLAVTEGRDAATEPGVHLTLYQAVLKGERFEWVLQKGTEIGISRFVPIICERSVVDDRRAIAAKVARWERIIQEAAEQSGRGRLPVLSGPQSLPEALAAAPADPAGHTAAPAGVLRLIPWEAERTAGLAAVLQGCNLSAGARIEVYIGPEGGLSEDEIHLAVRHGVRPVSLGPRILRAETAGLVAAAAILFQAGDLGP